MKRLLSFFCPERIRAAARLCVIGGVVAAAPASAQIADTVCTFCPDPEPRIRADVRMVELTWDEIPSDVGRDVSEVVKVFPNDTTGVSSDISLSGVYVNDCDLRLTFTKIPVPAPAFGVNVEIEYEVTDDLTNSGGVLGSGLVQVYQPDTFYELDRSVAGNLSVSFTSNVEQPTTTLGTIPVTISGLCTTSSSTTRYFVTALESVASLSEGLDVQVTGPLGPGSRTRLLTVDTPGVSFPIMDGLFISFGEGAAAPGDSVSWNAHYLFPAADFFYADLGSFEGYRIWRSNLPGLSNFALLGEIRQCESKDAIILLSEEEALSSRLTLRYDAANRVFTLIDEDIHNDFPYRYAVSTFDRGFLGNAENLTFEGELQLTDQVYPSNPVRFANRQVAVVPNPYNRRAGWEESGSRVVFTNLPEKATIRIFTAATDYVATIEHGPNQPASTSTTSASWDLRSEAGVSVASGIYIFYVEGTGVEVDPRTGETGSPQSIQQTGKLIVIR